MARRRRPGPSQGSRNAGSRGAPTPRFAFEPGEQSLALEAKVSSVALSTDGAAKIKGVLLEGTPAHLRPLGQRVTVTSPNSDVRFVVGPAVKRAHTFVVADGGTLPVFSVVGPTDETVALVFRGALLYKST
jgi:hypothetical protein